MTIEEFTENTAKMFKDFGANDEYINSIDFNRLYTGYNISKNCFWSGLGETQSLRNLGIPFEEK